MLSGLLFLIPLGMIFFLVLIVVVIVFEVLDIVDNSREHTGQQAQEPYNLFDFHVFLSFSVVKRTVSPASPHPLSLWKEVGG